MRSKDRVSIPVGALFDTALSATDLRVLAVISYHDRGRPGSSMPGHHVIASQAKCAECTASRCISKLVSREWVKREQSASDARRYSLHVCWDNSIPDPEIDGTGDIYPEGEYMSLVPSNSTEIDGAGDTYPEIDGVSVNYSEIDVAGAIYFDDSLLIGNYIYNYKSSYLSPKFSKRDKRAAEILKLQIVDEIDRAKSAICVLEMFGAEANYLVSKSHRNFYQEWILSKYTFRQLIDACVIAVSQRRKDNNTTPIGVSYVNAILKNPIPIREESASDWEVSKLAAEQFLAEEESACE